VAWPTESGSSPFSGTISTAIAYSQARQCSVSGSNAGKMISFFEFPKMSLVSLYKYNTSMISTPEIVSKLLTPISTNPSTALNMYIAFFRPDGTVGTISYRCNVELWLTTELTGITALSTS